jgi:hypothetical protein
MSATFTASGSGALQAAAGHADTGVRRHYPSGFAPDLRKFTYFSKVPARSDDTGGQEPRLRE